MLPIPNLDDRMFEQMVMEARKSIPKLYPEWTDENEHDPGITLLELMSWMTEMQQYYLNRITERNERKFLKLLGIRPREAVSAVCDVAFAGVEQLLVLPKGTPLQAMDQRFETLRTVQLVPAALEKVLVRTETAAADYSSNNHARIAYYAFGPEAGKGAHLYLGFDRPLPAETEISLSFKLYDRYPVSLTHGMNQAAPIISSAKVAWSFAGAGQVAEGRHGQSESWLPVELISDTTVHLSQSGEVRFRVASEMKPMALYPADDRSRYWVCCTLEEEGYELSPKIERVSLNAVQAAQQETLSEVTAFNSSGEPDQSFEVSTHLAYNGLHTVQVQDEQGRWRDWHIVAELEDYGPDDLVCLLLQDSVRRTTRLRFGDGVNGSIPPQGAQRVRLIAYTAEFDYARYVGGSKGLPAQTFEIMRGRTFKPSSMLLQVGYRPRGEHSVVWDDWQSVDDFDNSKSTDRHYVYDAAAGTIRFGNNEAGLTPPKSVEPNIRFIALQAGGGERGNVKDGLVTGFTEEPGVSVTNPFPARGGLEAETLTQAKLRVRRELDTPTRAVTGEDYERIASATPGLRVARVKAIPLYKPGMRDYPKVKAPAQMTVVVVPYSESDKPKASQGFLQTIKGHLDRHRLLTTELHVIPAAYIKITVHAVVVMEPKYKGEQRRIIQELRLLLQPMDHGQGSEGWRFGRTVFKGDIYGVISRIKGVVYVQDLWLDAEGTGFHKDGAGDIHIPPYALVYSGNHEVETISQADL
ncbi:putative baseplate assembly protein [Paenibacillus sp. GCM10023248]|uniref:putative baseplate assembly protein n=1 Tax=unclassified Paenibacillus TaxID=185978 RepID=UPI002377D25E|nr:putative baseplate assembly protein [Paenibacillus sp. MAHUQ-63]MDD9266885.1 putative baseplate assembly protein [Paenibacillus sp. MAHUQ-63]